MSHLIDIISSTDKFGVGLFLSEKAKQSSNKYRALLIGEQSTLAIEQDFMVTPDLDNNLMSAIKGKVYKEDY
jgi:hypothetical protein